MRIIEYCNKSMLNVRKSSAQNKFNSDFCSFVTRQYTIQNNAKSVPFDNQ